jgi:hypothetical protein
VFRANVRKFDPKDSLLAEFGDEFMPTGITRLIGGVTLRCGLFALWCLVAVGCAEVTNAPAAAEIATAGPAEVAATTAAADDLATSEPRSVAPVAEIPEYSIDEPPVATEPEPEPPSVAPGDIAPESSELAVVASAAPATREFEPAPSLIPSLVTSPTSAETLDFSSLVTRLRRTKAINLRTKVVVKNESNDLLEQFRAYHTQTGETTLADLQRSYDSLFRKLHSLLEDADPPLARDIDRSRAAIWEFLADPRKFNASHLMAGA